MRISRLHSYLVHPGKGLGSQPPVRGTAVEVGGALFPMLQKLFDDADKECRHAIAFSSNTPDEQKNDCLSAILEYCDRGTLAAGRKIAERLQKVTTNRSGLGLLFLMMGRTEETCKFVISRFPAEQGILAEEDKGSLTVEFLEKVFMKSHTSYKAAALSGTAPSTDFWKGRAIDKQINSAESAISEYWIREFLQAEFLTPGELGTRRFAVALRDAITKTPDLGIKAELSAACQLLKSFDRKVASAKGILKQLGLSEPAQDIVKEQFPRGRLFEEDFRFVANESAKLLAFKTVELSNGGMLSALTEHFDRIFEQHYLREQKDVVRFVTEGKVVGQRFRKGKL